jgi:antitoxin StbD
MTSLYEISYEILSDTGVDMDQVLTELVTTISEFKKNPNLEVRRADGKPFAVLTNNRPSFYVLSPEEYDSLLEEIWEARSAGQLKARTRQHNNSVRVSLDQLQ